MRTYITFLLVIIGFSAFGQMNASSQEDVEKRNREIEERKEEYIETFLFSLEGDEFQKELIKQRLYSYYDELDKLFKTNYEISLERKAALKELNENHFKDLEGVILDDDMSKIKALVDGKFDQKEAKKKMKRKKKKS